MLTDPAPHQMTFTDLPGRSNDVQLIVFHLTGVDDAQVVEFRVVQVLEERKDVTDVQQNTI